MRQPEDELRDLESAGLLRGLRPLDSPAGPRVLRNGRELWNFASNDYLGLAGHPSLAAAFRDGVDRYGTGSTASRLVCGTLPPHEALENALAEAKKTDAALVFSSGFATALGTIPAIVGKGDFVILDKLAHACLVDAARLSGATLRVFPHNRVDKLASLLDGIRAKAAQARILVVTESVFSMDGDLCPLAEIVGQCERRDALLLVDEAHGFGVLGETGMGLAEREGLQQRIAFQMGTFSKASGLAGGYIAASRPWTDLLINRARSFIYSTAPPPALAHATVAALHLIRSDEGARLRAGLHARLGILGAPPAPILPRVLGSNAKALAASKALEEAGFLVPAIRFPTVPRGTARLRISVSAAHPVPAVEDLAREIRKHP